MKANLQKTVLNRIKSIQNEQTFAEDLVKQMAQEKLEREVAAFKPVMDIWNSVKDLTIKHYRGQYYNDSEIPLSNASHRSQDREIQFYDYTGNFGRSFKTREINGTIAYFVGNGVGTPVPVNSISELTDAFIKHLATYTFIEK